MAINDKIEDIKGQAKEKVGEATDDPQLQAEGQNDQASASIKDKLHDAADKAADAVDSIKDKLNKND